MLAQPRFDPRRTRGYDTAMCLVCDNLGCKKYGKKINLLGPFFFGPFYTEKGRSGQWQKVAQGHNMYDRMSCLGCHSPVRRWV